MRPCRKAAAARLLSPLRCRRCVLLFFSVAYTVMCALDLYVEIDLLLTSRGITQPEAFCAGTTAAYRKGNGVYSALTPSTALHLLSPAPVNPRNLHPVWRAGFGTCHGSDICDGITRVERTTGGTDWVKVQRDAEAPRVYSAITLTLTVLLLLGNIVLIVKKHAAGLSISWKFVAVMPLLLLPVPISSTAVAVRARLLRTTANEVAALPSAIYIDPHSLSASTSPVSPPHSFT